MNNFFPFLYLNTAPTEKDYCHSGRSPTTAELITAVITGRGNLEVYATRCLTSPRRILRGSGSPARFFFSAFFFFFLSSLSLFGRRRKNRSPR